MMLDSLYRAIRPALFSLDAEDVHDRVVALLASLSTHPEALETLGRQLAPPNPRLAVEAFGLRFPSPLGIAAGLDKNAVAFPALLALGCGHVETGTVTPRPQPGNPKPRVFRLAEDRALINRMGFPGAGVGTVVANLAQRKRTGMIVGSNIGPNRASMQRGMATADIVACYRAVAASASYVTINVSSPNTPRLRELQRKAALREMLDAVNAERDALLHRPLLLKISPDLDERELNDLLQVATDARVDGIVAVNTTIERPPGLRSASRGETGGLSGAPLAPVAARMVRRIARETGGRLPIVAAGGIETGADVFAAIELGATLAQTYTGLIYRGPGMARMVAEELLAEMDGHGAQSLEEVRVAAV
jgi:dihydroorotate dehydrogenase